MVWRHVTEIVDFIIIVIIINVQRMSLYFSHTKKYSNYNVN